VSSCYKEKDEAEPYGYPEGALESGKYADGSLGAYDSDAMSISGGSSGEGQELGGLITAGEWNDLTNWDFWTDLLLGEEYSKMPEYWSMYTNNRISVQVQNIGEPVVNATVELLRNGALIWTAKTDNAGFAELWAGTFQKEELQDAGNLSLKVNGVKVDQSILLFEDGINTININTSSSNSRKVEISFIVDATGSMSDELEFLKADLKGVIDSVKSISSNADIYTSTVFYRDEGDEYVVKKSDFTNNVAKSVFFINQQFANGGGDFPEAVHTALKTAADELQWSSDAKTRIAFLLLDAPPHYEPSVVESLQSTIKVYAEKGIKLIPITASGIDKETEFLMRFMSILTNGTYVFITNHSGIGGEHLEASVGEYEVEFLKDLLVRLIHTYSE